MDNSKRTTIQRLRFLQESRRTCRGVAIFSTFCLFYGFAWCIFATLCQNPHMLLILVGAIGLVISLLMHPSGILIFFPRGFQDFLLDTTIFELIHDDSVSKNLIRRWGRVWLLARGGWNANEIKSLVQGLDPSFVEAIFRKTPFQSLPGPAQEMLLPSYAPRPQWPVISDEGQICSAVARGARSFGLPVHLGGTELTPEFIASALKERTVVKDAAVKEPALRQAVVGVFGVAPMLVRRADWVLLGVRRVCTFSGLMSAVAAVLTSTMFCFSRMLTQSPASWALLKSHGGRIRSSREAKFISAAGLLSLGGYVIIRSYPQTFAHLLPRKDSRAANQASTNDASDVDLPESLNLKVEREMTPRWRKSKSTTRIFGQCDREPSCSWSESTATPRNAGVFVTFDFLDFQEEPESRIF